MATKAKKMAKGKGQEARGETTTPTAKAPATLPLAGSIEKLTARGVRMVPIAEIDDSGNIRQGTDKAHVEKLRISYRTFGCFLQPIVLCEMATPAKGKTFQCLAGYTRLEAAAAEKAVEIEAKIFPPLNARTQAAVRIAENYDRKDLTPIEQALEMENARKAGLTTAEIAKAWSGISMDTVQKRLHLLKLCDEGRQLVVEGKLPVKYAEAIAWLPDRPAQLRTLGGCLSVKWDEKGKEWKSYSPWNRESDRTLEQHGGLTSFSDLLDFIGQSLGSLSAVKWPLGEPYAKKPACNGCPSRQLKLEGDLATIKIGQASKLGFCLDSGCYQCKMTQVQRDKQAADDREAKEVARKQEAARKASQPVCLCGAVQGTFDVPFVAAVTLGDVAAWMDKKQVLCAACVKKIKAGKSVSDGLSYEQQQKQRDAALAAAKKAFPATPDAKYACALWDFGQACANAIGKALSTGPAAPYPPPLHLSAVLSEVLAVSMQITSGNMPDLPDKFTEALAPGKPLTAADLAEIHKGVAVEALGIRPHVGYNVKPEMFDPSDKDELETMGIEFYAAWAAAWKLGVGPRPTLAAFQPEEAGTAAVGLAQFDGLPASLADKRSMYVLTWLGGDKQRRYQCDWGKGDSDCINTNNTTDIARATLFPTRSAAIAKEATSWTGKKKATVQARLEALSEDVRYRCHAATGVAVEKAATTEGGK